MDENTNEHRKIYERIGDLEVGMGKLETELPYIKGAVDRIEKKIGAGQVMLIGMLVSFIVSVILIFVKYVMSSLGGS